MHNRKKQDSITVNRISPPDDVQSVSKAPAENAGKSSFCIYDHQRHTVGSVIKNRVNDLETVCTEDGSWQNTDKPKSF